MKTKLIAVLVFVMISIVSSAQYKSVFGSESTSWNQLVVLLDESHTDSIYTSKDTIINATTYKIIYRRSWGGGAPQLYCFLRESNDKSQVYQFYPNDLFSDNPSNKGILVFDLNLKLGEKFIVGDDSVKDSLIVDSVFFDTNNKKHIRFSKYINHPLGKEKFEFIEGVGSNLGLFYGKISFSLATRAMYLLCEHQDGVLIYQNKLRSGYCRIDFADNLKQNINNTFISFYNHSSKEFIIKAIGDTQDVVSIIVYNSNGSLVGKYFGNTLPYTIDLSKFNKGLYLITCKTDAKVVTRKIIVL